MRAAFVCVNEQYIHGICSLTLAFVCWKKLTFAAVLLLRVAQLQSYRFEQTQNQSAYQTSL